jgi:hypothetical protein
VKKSVDFTKVNESTLLSSQDWKGGSDYSKSIYPGSSTLAWLESQINNAGAAFRDPYGHGTLVASIAAGGNVTSSTARPAAPGARSTTCACSGTGMGDVADALAGIDWVVFHAKEYNIRVLNVSLASDSTESYLTDPLCRAVRNAVAPASRSWSPPATTAWAPTGARTRHDHLAGQRASVITVGSANPHATSGAVTTLSASSARGPRAAAAHSSGIRHPDNLLSPTSSRPATRTSPPSRPIRWASTRAASGRCSRSWWCNAA